MATSWNGKIDNEIGRHTIQFETNNYDYYKIVEKACQKAVDMKNKERTKFRETSMCTLGHL